MSEWLDIVDTNDSVIGRAPREVVHSENHLHRSSHIVVFNTRGQVFVQLRSRLKDSNPRLWDTSAAGHVDSGENYLDCAVRELLEELGIIVPPDSLNRVGKLLPEQRNGFEFTELFTVCSDQQIVLQEEEIEEGIWVQPEELDRWIAREADAFTDIFRTIWPMVKQTIQ